MVPSKYTQLVDAGDEIPASRDVTSNEDAKSENGEGMHEFATVNGACLDRLCRLERVY